MNHDVFISYSRKDTAIADRICDAFDKAGISYFIDRQGIGGGFEFPQVLAEAIVGCRKFLFLASANSYVSKINSEITFAFNKKDKNSILPYRIDRSEIPLDLEFIFGNINWRNIEEHPIETVLVRDILQMLGRSGSPIVTPKTYRVGDYYNENGKEGVVFEVDATGRHGKIVGMKQEELLWCTYEEYKKGVAIGATDRTDGMKNMQTIRRIAGWREKYPAFAWCAGQGDGWYLPAIEELEKFTLDDSTHDSVNRTLSQHGGVALLNKKKEYKWYWSSSDNDEQCAWFVHMGDGYTCYYYKINFALVRAVSAF